MKSITLLHLKTMKIILPFGEKNTSIIKVSLVSLLLFSCLVLNAQTPANFAGKWVFYKAGSDKDETGDASFDGTIILEINQNSSTIAFTNTFIIPGKDPYVMQPDSYFPDGKVTIDNSGTGPAKKFAKWSQDKKAITTSLVMTDKIDGVAQDFTTALTYKLSEDGKSLSVDEFHKSKLNGERTIKKLYKKKL